MKAATINSFGNPDVFKIVESEKPIPKEDQILIQVFATSINPIDWKQRKGNHKLILGSKFPIILGYDVCGEIVEIGSNVNKFKSGDTVYGVLDNKYGGALAEFAIGSENCFAIKPESISNEEAAAYPMASLTSLQALRDKAKLQYGQTVLINGASGGVGHIALQMAKLMGARVIAVASSGSKDFVNQFEPDVFVDYIQQDIFTLDEKVDVVFDVASNLSFSKCKKILNPNGVYINLEYINTMKRMPLYKLQQLFSKGKRVKALLMKQNNEDLNVISKWVDEGKVKIHVDEVFNLKNIIAAHDYAQKGHNKGKNVVVINN
jgi:NADPH:quinone reductase-like Zn-dependent oxidoreductase